jgi:catechol 2,3-dioxygenase-like lactoylglutathione lyase family enzyme
MEDDPLPEENRRGRQDCPVAIRSITMSTPDFDYSCDFVTTALGMQAQAITLHGDEHEALWGLAGADCKRRVFGGPTLLLEIVEYVTPTGRTREPDWRINDQGILNICFGDAAERTGVDRMYQQSTAAGAQPNSRPQHTPLAGAFYTNDDLGFSYEFMWARPGIGHRQFGFVPQGQKRYPAPDNQRVESEISLPNMPEEVFAVLEDYAGMTKWAGLGRVSFTAKGFASDTGRGAEREIATPLGTVLEQIIDCEAPKLLRYRVIKGSPFINYIGEVTVQSEGGGSRVVWSLRFRSRIPGLGGLLRYVMQRKINATLQGLSNYLSSRRAEGSGLGYRLAK